MIFIKICIIITLLLIIGVGVVIRFNFWELQNKLVSFFLKKDIEEYIRYRIPEVIIDFALLLLCLTILIIS